MLNTQLPGRQVLNPLKGLSPVPKPASGRSIRRSLLTRNVLEVSKPANGSGPLDFGKSLDPASLEKDILSKAVYEVGVSPKLLPNNIPPKQAYQALARSVREALIEKFNATNDYWRCAHWEMIVIVTHSDLMEQFKRGPCCSDTSVQEMLRFLTSFDVIFALCLCGRCGCVVA